METLCQQRKQPPQTAVRPRYSLLTPANILPSDDDFLRIFLPLIDDEQRRQQLEEELLEEELEEQAQEDDDNDGEEDDWDEDADDEESDDSEDW